MPVVSELLHTLFQRSLSLLRLTSHRNIGKERFTIPRSSLEPTELDDAERPLRQELRMRGQVRREPATWAGSLGLCVPPPSCRHGTAVLSTMN